jgi:hypothetical protein
MVNRRLSYMTIIGCLTTLLFSSTLFSGISLTSISERLGKFSVSDSTMMIQEADAHELGEELEDQNQLLKNVDVDKVLKNVDVDKVLKNVDVDKVLKNVDVDKVLRILNVDVDECSADDFLNRFLKGKVTTQCQSLLSLPMNDLDLNEVAKIVDLNEVAKIVDKQLKNVDLNKQLKNVDLNQVAKNVDLNQVAKNVEDNVAKTVDVNQVLKNVENLNEVAKNVDLNQVAKNVDKVLKNADSKSLRNNIEKSEINVAGSENEDRDKDEVLMQTMAQGEKARAVYRVVVILYGAAALLVTKGLNVLGAILIATGSAVPEAVAFLETPAGLLLVAMLGFYGALLATVALFAALNQGLERIR